MDQERLKVIKEKLVAEQQRLENMLASFTKKDLRLAGDYDTLFPQTGTSLEESQDEVEEYENLIPLEHGLEVRLKNVTEALRKIEHGTYGACEKCSKEINNDRLEALPEARFCTDCAK